ncbi:Calcineurin subunit B [Diplonema papillatum]|nr:Calcineurin subunit B [Diplonema papillatum]
MGGSGSKPLKPGSVEIAHRELFLTKDEIERAYVLFHNVSISRGSERDAEFKGALRVPLPFERDVLDDRVWKGGAGGTKLMRIEQFLSLVCFKRSPLAPRVYKVFKDRAEGMSFGSFLLLVSCLSERAPFEVKAMVAFRLFDFDDDSVIQVSDLKSLLEVYIETRDLWQEAEQEQVEQKVAIPLDLAVLWEAQFPRREESKHGFRRASTVAGLAALPEVLSEALFDAIDNDSSRQLTENDFEKLLSTIPDFAAKFTVDILR